MRIPSQVGLGFHFHKQKELISIGRRPSNQTVACSGSAKAQKRRLEVVVDAITERNQTSTPTQGGLGGTESVSFLFLPTNHPRKSSIPSRKLGPSLAQRVSPSSAGDSSEHARISHLRQARAQNAIGVPPSKQTEGCLTKPRRKQCLRGYGISSRVVTAGAKTERNQQSVTAS